MWVLVDDNAVAACIAEMKYKKDVGDEGIPVEILKMLPSNGISRLKLKTCLIYVYNVDMFPQDLKIGS